MNYTVRRDLLVRPGLRQVLPDPFKQFAAWYRQAEKSKTILQPNAFCLSSIDPKGFPDARIVLLKEFNSDGFVFFTNVESSKGKSFTRIPRAALTFFWESLNRQIRIQGTLTRVSDREATAYFQSRPRESQLGAWASKQSHPVQDRDALMAAYHAAEKRFKGVDPLPRPAEWGGYRLKPLRFEFWQAGPYRLHDRFSYQRTGRRWTVRRLYP